VTEPQADEHVVTASSPDLVLLGNLLVDDVVFPDGRTRMAQPGGAILYASLAAALWGARAGCVSLRGDDYPQSALDALRARGIALDGVHTLGMNGVRTWLLYEGNIRRVVHRLGCPSHEAVSPTPEHVPAAWRRARAFHLAPMPIASQRALVEAIRSWERPEAPALLSLDPHLPLDDSTIDEWRALLSQVDVFLPSDDEMHWPEATKDPLAFGRLAGGRLRHVLWKQGVSGGTMYDVKDRRVSSWRAGGSPAKDPTGAGDAFMAGFVTSTLEGAEPAEALRRAAVTATFAIQAWGPDGLLNATRDEAEARLAVWRSAT
jgi:sugar/nucleoside kinase (ribokinase family)